MPARWETLLDRWRKAELIDAATAENIRTFETQQSENQTLHWPTILAISFGGVMLGAGVLLFVAAHWAKLSPAERFASVVSMVALFHLLGAFLSDRFPHLGTVFHALGTVSLGAAIFLAAQIFNLEEGWDGGVLLWAIGAAIGWALRRDWVQAMFTAILGPVWLIGRLLNAAPDSPPTGLILAEGACMLAITYLSARVSDQASALRRSLVWIGGIAIIPCVIWVPFAESGWFYGTRQNLGLGLAVLGWAIAILLPLAVAFLLRGSRAWINLLAIVWVLVLGSMQIERPYNIVNPQTYQELQGWAFFWNKICPYIWCALGSMGLIAWGLNESRRERVNFGVIGFGLSVACFYFSSVMDKLGRSESLIGFGVLFLVGGWFLERARRRLLAHMTARPS